MINLKAVEQFVKTNRVKSILQIKPVEIKKIHINELTLQATKDIFEKKLEDVGKIKVQIRNTGEFADVNIWRKQEGGFIKYELKHGESPIMLMDCENLHWDKMKPSDKGYKKYKNKGLHIAMIFKYSAGENFKSLAKTMDILAVKESLMNGLGGSVYLSANPNTSPLHWARGYRHEDYYTKFSLLKKYMYDKFMKNKYKKYVDSRAMGKDINTAKNEISKRPIENEVMELQKDIVNKYIRIAKSINYNN